MPWLPLYCAQTDLPTLLELLGDDIAFIIPDGRDRWRAFDNHKPLDGSRTLLWHVPSGPIPSRWEEKEGVYFPRLEPSGDIEDPWSGWQEDRRPSLAKFAPGLLNPETGPPTEPIVGLSHPGTFRLNLRIAGRDPNSVCGMSSIEWIGNQYSIIGRPAPTVTEKRWKKLRRQVAKVAEKIPRGGLRSNDPPEIWAFPHAMKNIEIADKNP